MASLGQWGTASNHAVGKQRVRVTMDRCASGSRGGPEPTHLLGNNIQVSDKETSRTDLGRVPDAVLERSLEAWRGNGLMKGAKPTQGYTKARVHVVEV